MLVPFIIIVALSIACAQDTADMSGAEIRKGYLEELKANDSALNARIARSDSSQIAKKTEKQPPKFWPSTSKRLKLSGEAAFAYSQCAYETTPFPEFEYGGLYVGDFAVGMIYHLEYPYRLRFGFRFYQAGLSADGKIDFTDFKYDSTGYNIIGSVPGYYTGWSKTSYYYISLPVSCDLFLNSFIYATAGCDIGFLVGGSYRGEGTYVSEYHPAGVHEAWNESIRRSSCRAANIAGSIGMGSRIPFWRKLAAEIQVVYAFGFFGINNPTNWPYTVKTREISARYIVVL